MPKFTTHGVLHNVFTVPVFTVPVFTALPAACFVVARRFGSGRRGWASYSVRTGAAVLMGYVLAGRGFSQDPTFMPIGGCCSASRSSSVGHG